MPPTPHLADSLTRAQQVLQQRVWWWEDPDPASEGKTLQVPCVSQETVHRSRPLHSLYAGEWNCARLFIHCMQVSETVCRFWSLHSMQAGEHQVLGLWLIHWWLASKSQFLQCCLTGQGTASFLLPTSYVVCVCVCVCVYNMLWSYRV